MSIVERLAVKWGDVSSEELGPYTPGEHPDARDARWWLLAIAEELEAAKLGTIDGDPQSDAGAEAARWLREEAGAGE